MHLIASCLDLNFIKVCRTAFQMANRRLKLVNNIFKEFKKALYRLTDAKKLNVNFGLQKVKDFQLFILSLEQSIGSQYQGALLFVDGTMISNPGLPFEHEWKWDVYISMMTGKNCKINVQ